MVCDRTIWHISIYVVNPTYWDNVWLLLLSSSFGSINSCLTITIISFHDKLPHLLVNEIINFLCIARVQILVYIIFDILLVSLKNKYSLLQYVKVQNNYYLFILYIKKTTPFSSFELTFYLFKNALSFEYKYTCNK